MEVEHNTYTHVNRIVPMALGESHMVLVPCLVEEQSLQCQCSCPEGGDKLLPVGVLLQPLQSGCLPPLHQQTLHHQNLHHQLGHNPYPRLNYQGQGGDFCAAFRLGPQQEGDSVQERACLVQLVATLEGLESPPFLCAMLGHLLGTHLVALPS